VNDAPSFTKGADETVSEDSGPHTVVGWATAISAGPSDESSQTLNFVVTNDNNGLFSTQPAVSSNGTLTYASAPDANGSATVSVSLHDNGGTANGGVDTSATQTFTITVTAVNDAPSFTEGGNQTVDEDSGAHTVAGWATAISAGPADESSQTLNFIVTNDNNGLFTAGGQPAVAPNGTLTYTSAPDANGSATVTVSLHDNGGTANGGADTSATQTFTITVNAVNDAPDVSSASFGGIGHVVCPANTGANNATLSVTFSDIDDTSGFTATIDWDSNPLTTGDNEGPFPVSVSGSQPYTFTRAHSYPTVGAYTATVTVYDDDGLSDSGSTATASLTVDYNTSGILQPVNWTQAHNDPSIFKWGSTVPVKVRFFNCDGTNAGSGLSVRIEVRKTAGSTPGIGDLETITNTNSPDSGGLMRWSGDLYMYNLSTGSLSDKTATYEIKLTVQSTGQTVTTEFGTKAK
jgi:hypothetical protein